MSINQCIFTGYIITKPTQGKSRTGQDYIAFTLAIDNQTYNPQTQRTEPTTAFADIMAFDYPDAWRLHTGTQVICVCYLQTIVKHIAHTDYDYTAPTFIATRIDIGKQPEHNQDIRLWDR